MPAKLLYVSAANIDDPRNGTDLCARCHFDELAGDGQLDIAAISITPTPVEPLPGHRPIQNFPADLTARSTSGERLRLKLALLAIGGILFQSGFRSEAARAALRAQLAAHPDVLLIDHITALANISLFQLLRLRLAGRTKIVMISHDISADFLRDRARLQTSALKRLAIQLHAMHSKLYETVVFALATRVVFISDSDRERFRFVARAKTVALCPVLDLPPDDREPAAAASPYLVFIGSPSFFPNGYAVDWITKHLAPALLARLPALQIRLVGKGTDGIHPDRPSNVVGLGFVDDDQLHPLLRRSLGSLSPVVHGSGLKIKVLEAIAAGSAIFATASSLRGFGFMDLEPLLDIDDPAASADRICAVIGDPPRRAAYEARIVTNWQQYQRERRGGLATLVKHVAGAAPVPFAARSAP